MRNYKQIEEKTKRDDRVRYYVIKLKNIVSKNELFELIEKKGITSKSTAKRVAKSVFDWGKGEIDLFLATYIPTKSDSKAIDAVLVLNASKVSSEVIEVDKCTECGTEAAYTIYELAAKNQELQKELQKYKNDLNIVLDDRRKLECLLHDDIHDTEQSKDFRAIIEEMIQLHTAKNKDYGNAFTQSYAEFGTTMCAIRINDKLNRFKTLIKQNNEIKTESIKDTLIDLANYAIMTIIEIEKEEKWRD